MLRHDSQGKTCFGACSAVAFCVYYRYDDLRNYNNERSMYLAQLRHSIEEPWQQWEMGHFDVDAYKSKSVEEVRSATHSVRNVCICQ